eukprot:TRINITY_DN4543_c0_g1_i3.p2 TRINITY_DN4543_c0_g1~~TRINITY_DN4543_c0_g1_i3.p2  ORF type:complete len:191 (+),score=46.67 TRINITY_DN4543_c0_g1_i3:251-823(+)
MLNKELNKTKYPTAEDINKKYKALSIKIQQALSVTVKTIVLEERKELRIVFLEGQVQHCRVELEGKKSPLMIFVKVLKGDCKIVGTSKNSEPKRKGSLIESNKSATEAEYIYDSAYRTFLKKTLYLGIRGLTHTVMTVSVEFGLQREKVETKKSRVRMADELIAKINEEIKIISTDMYLVKKINDVASTS